jgi:hypothetical protein
MDQHAGGVDDAGRTRSPGRGSIAERHRDITGEVVERPRAWATHVGQPPSLPGDDLASGIDDGRSGVAIGDVGRER